MVEFAVTRTRTRRDSATKSTQARVAGHTAESAARARVVRRARWANGYRSKLRVTDACVLVIAMAATFLVRLSVHGFQLGTRSAEYAFAVTSFLIIAVWSVNLSTFRSREPRVVGVGIDEYKRVLNASTTTFGLLGGVFLVFQADSARWFFTVAFPVGLAGLVLSRWAWRRWLVNKRASGQYLSRVIVIGALSDVEKVVHQIRSNSGAAYTVVGAVVEEHEVQSTAARLKDLVVRGDLTRVAEFAKKFGVDGVIVAGHPSDDTEFIRDLAWKLEGGMADLILATSLANVAGPRIHFRPIEGLPLIHVEIPQFDGAKHAVKRALDVVMASIALVVLAPVFGVVAALIKLDSDGPVFFAQERVGKSGQPFRILKFRSMTVDAPQRLEALIANSEGNGVLFKMKDDPRVTRLGRTLRKYSIDELPQLWNVLRGEMSLVGPRPPLAAEVTAYEDHVHRRLYIKPGLTGMWQVNGRSNLSWEDSVRLDLYYVENWSLMGDLIILWRTVKVVARPVGAY
jgi:exopolysaccharide biosynthesis polyprenyl glycosylphosphotransferase